jgi:hypothetical protein
MICLKSNWLSIPSSQITTFKALSGIPVMLFLENALRLPGEQDIAWVALNDSRCPTHLHSISVASSAGSLAGPPIDDADESLLRRRHEAGMSCAEMLCSLSTELRPLYSSVTVEYTLESLADLAVDSRSLAFTDFYVRRDLPGRSSLLLDSILGEFYKRLLPSGTYYSSTSAFNPDGISLDRPAALELSCQVATILATLAQGSRAR